MTFEGFMAIVGTILLSAKFLFWMFVFGVILWAFFKYLGTILSFIFYGVLGTSLLIFLFFFMLTGCSLAPDSIGVSIEDLEGFGNPDIEECNITFDGSPPIVPCVIEVQVEWEI